ncbi:hypothetical protein [Clostridium tagluense]|nr:hypothetical protein [Clostridium tagluense]
MLSINENRNSIDVVNINAIFSSIYRAVSKFEQNFILNIHKENT